MDSETLIKLLARYRVRGLDRALAFVPHGVAPERLADYCIPVRTVAEDDFRRAVDASASKGRRTDERTLERLTELKLQGTPLNGWLRRQHKRVVIKGEPGEGKTTALWLFVADACKRLERELAARADANTWPPLPLLLPLRKWVPNTVHGGSILEAAAAHTAELCGMPDHAPDLAAICKATGGALLLDGFDELDPQHLEALRDQLGEVEQPVVLTTRYHSDPGLVMRRHDLLRMAPLAPWMVERFIANYFPPAEVAVGSRLRTMLRQAPALRSLSRNPLMLAAMCFAATSRQGSVMAATRAGVIEAALRAMMRRAELKAGPGARTNTARHTTKLRLLSVLAWVFSGTRPQPMPREAIVAALTRSAEWADSAAIFAGNADALIEELESDGILVRHGQAPFGFLVRPFHEFCAAYWLAQQEGMDGALLRRPFTAWPAPLAKDLPHYPLRLVEWTEVWILGAGLAGLSQPLVSALEMEWRQAEDVVHSRLRLLTHALGEHLRSAAAASPHADRSGAQVSELCAALLPLCLEESGLSLPHTWRHSMARLPADQVVPLVMDKMQTLPVKERDNLILLLGEIGSAEASRELLACFHGESADEWEDVDLLQVAVALGLIGDEHCKAALQRRVEPPLHTSGYTPYACMLALARIGDPDCVETITRLARHPETPEDLRWQIILDCGKLLGPEVEPLLFETLASITETLVDPSLSPLSNAFAEACKNLELCSEILATKGSPEAAEHLELMLDLPMSENARKWVCTAIAACGDMEHRQVLRDRIMNPGRWSEVSNWAALALVQVGDEAVLDKLLDAASDEAVCPAHLRQAVVAAAGSCVGDKVEPFLLRCLRHDTSAEVRATAAKALAGRPGRRITDALQEMLLRPDASPEELRASAFSLAQAPVAGSERPLLNRIADKAMADKERRQMIRALESSESAEARDLLLGLWQTEPGLRSSCVLAMAEIQRSQGWRPMPDGTWQNSSAPDMPPAAQTPGSLPPSKSDQPIWRFTLRETRTLKTKVEACLEIHASHDGNRLVGVERVEVTRPTNAQLEELRWYVRASIRRRAEDRQRAAAVEAMLKQLGGRMLLQVLRASTADRLWDRALDPGHKVIWEIQGSPDFQSVPWEWLFDKERSLHPALHQTLRRRITEAPTMPAWTPTHRPLSILWVTSRPAGDKIRRDLVLGPVREALDSNARVQVIDSGNFEHLLQRLRPHRDAARYHIVHLDMHGCVTTWQDLVARSQRSPHLWDLEHRSGGLNALPKWDGETSVLLFEAEDGRCTPVTAEELSRELALHRVPMVVLNACESALVPVGDAALVAHLVMKAQFSALGFNDVLTLDGAVIFFKAFYTHLVGPAGTDSLEAAINAGRLALHGASLRHGVVMRDWFLPVWYTARDIDLPAGAEPNASAQELRDTKPMTIELPERNARFAGREQDLEALHALLSNQANVGVVQQAGLHAQGGVGKTSVALEYAWRCADPLHAWHGSYPGGIYFLPCDTPDLRPVMAALARRLQLREVFSEAEILQALKLHLEKGAACLFVLDNVHDGQQWTSAGFRDVIPGHPCKRLITTRTEQLPGVQAYHLPGMTRADGIALLGKYRPDALAAANREVAGDIVDWFNGLAVGLAVTGVYMALHEQLSWEQFAQLLDRLGLGYVRAMERELALRQGGSVLPDYAKRVDGVFDETLAALPAEHRVGLEYAALLAEDDVPSDWLTLLLSRHWTEHESEATATHLAQGTIRHLTGLGLLHEINSSGSWLGMHRVLRERMHERLAQDAGKRKERLDALGELALATAVRSHESPQSEDLGLLATALHFLPSLANEGDPDKALNLAVYLWLTLGERNGRIQELAAAFAALRPHFPRYRDGNKEQRILLSLHLTHLGGIARGLGRYADALTHFQQASDIVRQDDPTGSALSQRLSNLALAQYELGSPRAALKVYREVLKMERAKGKRSAHLGRTLSNVGMCYHALRKYSWAAWVACCAISQYRQNAADDPLELAKSENNLALALLELGKFGEALPLMEGVLASEREHLDPTDPAIAWTLHNLAFCLHRMRLLDAAELRYQEAIDVAVAAYGFEHENCLLFYSNIMPLFLEQGKLPAAKSACDAALGILQRLEDRGERHAEAVSIYLNATHVHEALGMDQRAIELISSAIASASPPEVARYTAILARLWEKTEQWEHASQAWQQAIDAGRKHRYRETILIKWEVRRDEALKQTAAS